MRICLSMSRTPYRWACRLRALRSRWRRSLGSLAAWRRWVEACRRACIRLRRRSTALGQERTIGRRQWGMATRSRLLLARLFLGRRPMASASMRWLVLVCVRPMSRASIRQVGNRGNCIRDKTRMPLFLLLQARGSLPELRARFRKMKMWQKLIACVSSRRFEGLMAICFWRQSSWA